MVRIKCVIRDAMRESGFANATIRRKMTALRSLFSYLQVYGYVGANPAHGKFVSAPAVPRDGKTVGLFPKECRRLLQAPGPSTPEGIRDRALLGILAYSACRVGELVALPSLPMASTPASSAGTSWTLPRSNMRSPSCTT